MCSQCGSIVSCKNEINIMKLETNIIAVEVVEHATSHEVRTKGSFTNDVSQERGVAKRLIFVICY